MCSVSEFADIKWTEKSSRRYNDDQWITSAIRVTELKTMSYQQIYSLISEREVYLVKLKIQAYYSRFPKLMYDLGRYLEKECVLLYQELHRRKYNLAENLEKNFEEKWAKDGYLPGYFEFFEL